MRISILGIRGLPASYAGFETAAEEITTRLAERGHEITVYNRSQDIAYRAPSYKGVRLVRIPTWHSKHFATMVHTFLSTLHALTTKAEVVHYFGGPPGALSFIARLFGKKTVCSVDGLDWSRDKWGKFAQGYLRVSESIVIRAAHAIVTDSAVGEQYYREKYGLQTLMIAYGGRTDRVEGAAWLEKFGVEPRRYILSVGRLVPDKNVHHLISAFEQIDTDMKLVIVGDDLWSKDYIESLKRMAGPRVVFAGYLYGEGCAALQSNAYLFALPQMVGGTPPVLLEAMGYGNCVLVSDTPFHMETIGEAGVSFDLEQGDADLKQKLERLIHDPQAVDDYRRLAVERVVSRYQWDQVVDAHEQLYARLLGGRSETTVPGQSGELALPASKEQS